MNPDQPRTPREALELRVTSLLLGELPAAEATAVREAIAKDSELAKLHDDLKQTIHLVRAAATIEPTTTAPETPALKLSGARRKKLVAAFTIPPLKPEHRQPNSRTALRLIEVLAVFAILAVLAAMLLPSLAKSKARAQRVTVASNLHQIETAKQMWADDNQKSAGAAPTLEELKPYLGGRGEPPPVMGETYSAGKVGEPAFAEMSVKDAQGHLRLPAGSKTSDRVQLSAEGKVSFGTDLQPAMNQSGGGNRVIEHSFSVVNRGKAGPESAVAATSPRSLSTTTVVLPEAEVNSDAAGAFVTGTSGVEAKDATKLGFQTWGLADTTRTQPATRGFYDDGRDTARNDPYAKTPQIAAATEPPAMFYRFSGGGGGGGGGISSGQPVPAAPAPTFTPGLQAGDKVAVLGDILTLGKAFRSDSSGANYQVTAGGEGRAVSLTPAQEKAQDFRIKVENLGTLPDQSAVEFETATPRGRSASDNWYDGQPQQQGNRALTESSKRLSEVQLRNTSKESVTDLFIDAETRSLSVDASAAATPAESAGREILARQYGGVSTVTNAVSSSSSLLSSGLSGEIAGGAALPLLRVPATIVSNGHVLELVGYDDPGGFVAYAQAGGGRGQPLSSSTPLPRYRAKSTTADENSRPTSGESLQPIGSEVGAANTPHKVDALARYAELSGRTVLTAPGAVAPQVSVDLKKNETKEEELKTLETALALEGVAVVNVDGKFAKAVPQSQAGQEGASVSARGAQANLETRVFDVDPNTFYQGLQSVNGGKDVGGGLRFTSSTNGLVLASETVRKFYGDLGVDLKPESGRNLFLNDREGKLYVRATPEELDKISQANKVLATALPGVQVKARFVELAQKQAELAALQEKLNKRESDVPVRKASTNAPIPQPEIQTRENSFSTFSLNVSDVSFKLAMASLEQGQMPDAASVRSEEFINAFDYHDPEPAVGAPIAFAWERARYPFAHNRDLLRFSIKTAAAGRQAGRPLNIVLLLDNSGSMERADRVQIIRQALRVLAGQLQPQDKLSVITFARTARLVVDGISGDKAGEVAEQVGGITPQGGTNLEEAMNLAYQTAARHYLANGINRVVMLTDGAANLGDVEPESLKQRVEAQRKQGIALDCFGIGWDGFNDDLLETLSRNGDGRYGFLNSPEEAATDFVGQLAGALKVAASDVKVQVEFNPKRATAYRQIGYAKHQLTKEQFRDNTVDAAEIAAQEAGNALYTVELNPRGEGPICVVRARYKVPGTTTYRELEWLVPFTGNAPALEQASPAMRLAAGASAFSEWLVASPLVGEVTPDRLLGLLRGVPEAFGADSRPKKLEWMIRQARSLEGK